MSDTYVFRLYILWPVNTLLLLLLYVCLWARYIIISALWEVDTSTHLKLNASHTTSLWSQVTSDKNMSAYFYMCKARAGQHTCIYGGLDGGSRFRYSIKKMCMYIYIYLFIPALGEHIIMHNYNGCCDLHSHIIWHTNSSKEIYQYVWGPCIIPFINIPIYKTRQYK